MKVSISRVKLFKACRRAYWLKYVQGLEPVQRADALETGLTYHELIETLYKFGDLLDVEEQYSKEQAMAVAYQKYIYPQFAMRVVEEWFEYPLNTDDTLIGRIDGIADDGWLVEHKTTGSPIGEDYEYSLQWDEQILAYMLATGARKMWYTICRKPTLRQKKDETQEEFFQRMVDWYDEDTDSKIRLLQISRTDEEVEAFRQSLLATVWEMKYLQNVQDEERFYCNPQHCMTWGRRCEYSPVCLTYNPDEDYIEFTKNEERGRNYDFSEIR